jgi:hypothetical protein
MYLRITDTDKELSAPAGFFRHNAAILEVFKQPDGSSSGLAETTFLEDQRDGAPEPYEAGEDLLLFLRWSPAQRMTVLWHAEQLERSDGYTVSVVQNGRVTKTRGSVPHYVGAPIEVLLPELRKISARQ